LSTSAVAARCAIDSSSLRWRSAMTCWGSATVLSGIAVICLAHLARASAAPRTFKRPDHLCGLHPTISIPRNRSAVRRNIIAAAYLPKGSNGPFWPDARHLRLLPMSEAFSGSAGIYQRCKWLLTTWI
jgi:hypothetical protein